MQYAVNFKNNEALKLLLDFPGIDVNILDNQGRSALHVAVHFNNIEGVEAAVMFRIQTLQDC